jgi:hypothetical protein
MPLSDPAPIKPLYESDWFKILATALVTALFTEPIKVWFQNRIRRRQMRKSVLSEVGFNLKRLKEMAYQANGFLLIQRPDMALKMLDVQAESLQHTAFDKAIEDYYLFRLLPDEQLIRSFYNAIDRINSDISANRNMMPSSEDVSSVHGITYYIKQEVEFIASELFKRSSNRRFIDGTSLLKDSWNRIMDDVYDIQKTESAEV